MKKYNNIIYSWFTKLNDKYYKLDYDKDNVKKYIDNWIKNKKLDDFDFDIFSDLMIFLKK